jgi:UDP-N-acetylglucosamine/UDP-N-acetylgalactosamine 4-epimerase
MNALTESLRARPRRWLVTGCAGFIGSNLADLLLRAGQEVVGLDNFSTGKRSNLDEIRGSVDPAAWARFSFIEGDLRSLETCRTACAGVQRVFHQGALASVPRSIEDPVSSTDVNVSGSVNLFVAARDAGVERLVYASSSSVYGDDPGLPKREDTIGRALSPYALSKRVDELYAELFASTYGMSFVGLRYFNVFGRRQDPTGVYSAVIPLWIAAMLRGEAIQIFGDGSTTRDFCYIDNVLQANLLAATVESSAAMNQAYNIAVGERMSLNELYRALRGLLEARHPGLRVPEPIYRPFRAGDVLHSLADISKARALLGYEPRQSTLEGLREGIPWYEEHPS